MNFRISPEVRLALTNQQPVVALESTIISHGMPYPENAQTAKEVEAVVRENGAIPATIAILKGVIHVGLNEEELDKLAKKGLDCVKCTRRNLPYVTSNRLYGSTTVAATMYIAHQTGIRFFVTGGIGGVHRGAETTWDISADLVELGRTPVCVICAGAKSILDIPKTLEYLETQGVPVLGYQTDEFPAFFSPKSNCPVTCRMETEQQCALFVKDSLRFGLQNGVLIGVPLDEGEIAHGAEAAIQQALQEASDQGIQGAHVTPFLLRRINEISGGDSLRANIALIKNNAKIGARISHAYAQLSRSCVILGGMAYDIIAKQSEASRPSGEAPGNITTKIGGVAYNIAAEVASSQVILIACVGSDQVGESLIAKCRSTGINTDYFIIKGARSASFMAMVDADGKMVSAVADMDIFNLVTVQDLEEKLELLRLPSHLVMDVNFSAEVMQWVAEFCRVNDVKLIIDPTAEWQCVKLRNSGALRDAYAVLPNINELWVLLDSEHQAFELQSCVAAGRRLIEEFGVKNVIVTLGEEGVLWVTAESHQHFPISEIVEISGTDVGTGDIFAGNLLKALMTGSKMAESILLAMEETMIKLKTESSKVQLGQQQIGIRARSAGSQKVSGSSSSRDQYQ